MVLLHILYEMRNIHKGLLHAFMTFDHGIREASSSEAKMVKQFVAKEN